MRRCGTAAAVVIAVAVALPGYAHAAETLDQARTQVATLDQQISAARSLVGVRQTAAAQASRRLVRAANRLALEEQRNPVRVVLPWQFVSAGRSAARMAALRGALTRAQREVRAGRALPRLMAAQTALDNLTRERAAAVAVEHAIEQATIADATAAGGTTATSRGAWAGALLQAVGAPQCGDNLAALVAWQTAENTTAAWNPLATTLGTSTSTTFNSAGVANYPTLTDGLNATVLTLKAGYATQGYGWILYQLGQCAPAQVTAQAINGSNWCWRCAGGRYVLDILPLVEADYNAYAAVDG